ncbi:type 1 glutamine amidotransferase [Geomonas sp. Red32]|uniref:type 1 glutamine amidotransferase n=1 Tax=Geomonas sp. Red32 TaxID=2912856 RepID=UPI00202CD856|nr:type 1 glutamine amidotransferase [Geomonas sp. Red32]MCM0084116.1 type 1 glutamine amidotransferase [Geomonas sp. Red32]
MFLIIQNDRKCPPGSITSLLEAAGQTYRCAHAYAQEPLPDPASLTGVIVLGGEMGAHDTVRFPYLETVGDFMVRSHEAGTPLLGICLGGQLLAKVTGGVVSSPSPHGEQGICRVLLNDAGAADPLFSGVDREFVTFQLHNDSFTPPAAAALLAASPVCPAQAFRLGATTYGVQFHPEVDHAIVSSWGRISTPPCDLLTGFRSQEEAFRASSTAILSNFISLALATRIP